MRDSSEVGAVPAFNDDSQGSNESYLIVSMKDDIIQKDNKFSSS